MSRSKQPYLPKFERKRPFPGSRAMRGCAVWYYVYKPRTDEMLAMEDDGDWCWVEHDTIRDTPHLFNTRQMALQQARRLGNCQVHKYRWVVEG